MIITQNRTEIGLWFSVLRFVHYTADIQCDRSRQQQRGYGERVFVDLTLHDNKIKHNVLFSSLSTKPFMSHRTEDCCSFLATRNLGLLVVVRMRNA